MNINSRLKALERALHQQDIAHLRAWLDSQPDHILAGLREALGVPVRVTGLEHLSDDDLTANFGMYDDEVLGVLLTIAARFALPGHAGEWELPARLPWSPEQRALVDFKCHLMNFGLKLDELDRPDGDENEENP
jgi:hypothetical protein